MILTSFPSQMLRLAVSATPSSAIRPVAAGLAIPPLASRTREERGLLGAAGNAQVTEDDLCLRFP